MVRYHIISHFTFLYHKISWEMVHNKHITGITQASLKLTNWNSPSDDIVVELNQCSWSKQVSNVSGCFWRALCAVSSTKLAEPVKMLKQVLVVVISSLYYFLSEGTHLTKSPCSSKMTYKKSTIDFNWSGHAGLGVSERWDLACSTIA